MGLFRGDDFGRANPANRPALDFRGNSAHSSGFYAPTHGACMYQGGWLRYNATTNYLDFSSGLYARSTWDANAPATMLWRDTKLWRCNGGAVWWGSSVELRGLEVHDARTAVSLLGTRVAIADAVVVSPSVAAASAAGVVLNSSIASATLQRVTFRGYDAVALHAGALVAELVLDTVAFENTPRSAVQLLGPNVTVSSTVPALRRPACTIPWDLTGDGVVDSVDLGALLTHWGPVDESSSALDCNSDGVIGVVDVACMLDAFVTKWFSL